MMHDEMSQNKSRVNGLSLPSINQLTIHNFIIQNERLRRMRRLDLAPVSVYRDSS